MRYQTLVQAINDISDAHNADPSFATGLESDINPNDDSLYPLTFLPPPKFSEIALTESMSSNTIWTMHIEVQEVLSTESTTQQKQEALDRTREILRDIYFQFVLVYGYDGMDEITTTDKTKVCELKDGEIKSYFITHDSFGISKAEINDFVVNSPAESAHAISGILGGEKGPRRDIVLLNASAAIVAGGGADDLRDGVHIAEKSIDSGNALASLKQLIKMTNAS